MPSLFPTRIGRKYAYWRIVISCITHRAAIILSMSNERENGFSPLWQWRSSGTPAMAVNALISSIFPWRLLRTREASRIAMAECCRSYSRIGRDADGGIASSTR